VEIKSINKFGVYFSVQNILSSFLLSKHLNIKMYRHYNGAYCLVCETVVSH
jgi:hypothetical protein